MTLYDTDVCIELLRGNRFVVERHSDRCNRNAKM